MLLKAAEEASGQTDFYRVGYQWNNLQERLCLNSFGAARIKAKRGVKGNDLTPEVWEIFVRQMLSEVMAAEVEELCGPKHLSCLQRIGTGLRFYMWNERYMLSSQLAPFQTYLSTAQLAPKRSFLCQQNSKTIPASQQ